MSREEYAAHMRLRPAADATEDASGHDRAGYADEPAGGDSRSDSGVHAQGMTRSQYADYMRQGPAAGDDSPGSTATVDPGALGGEAASYPEGGTGTSRPQGKTREMVDCDIAEQSASEPADSQPAGVGDRDTGDDLDLAGTGQPDTGYQPHRDDPGHRPETLRDTPRDPVTGNQLEARDAEFLGYHPRQMDWFRTGEAPLGMTPETYRDWSGSLRDALRADGIPPESVDVRLLGSAARGFSGPHKMLPADDEITASHPPDVAETALQRKEEWLGDDPGRLRGRPFDAMNRLGLDEPSDYDTNVSSDLMVAKAREHWQADGEHLSFLRGDHEYVNKDIAREAFPNVQAWARSWTERLGGRDVSWAVFPGTGPKDCSASGHYVHFRDDDWIVFRPKDS
jgi:hypothetical protein